MIQKIVIVGAGECGVRAALALRGIGFDGDITLLGEERHHPYERPPLSKEALTSKDALTPKTIADQTALEEIRVRCMLGQRISAIDPARQVVDLADGTALAYDRLLLTTGATARRLPNAIDPEQQVIYLRTFDDAQNLRQRLQADRKLVVIGGGFIGLELAASARQLGLEITVIEAQPRVLMRVVPEAIADVVAARHNAEGIKLLCGTGVRAIRSHQVELDNGDYFDADVIVAGIGAAPAIELAESAGLTTNNGIQVDQTLRTSNPNIYAAGDCCSFPLALYNHRRIRLEAWRNAQDQGNLAAKNLLGAEESISAVPWFWSDQFDLSLQIAGLVDEGRETITRPMENDAFILFHLAEDGRLVAASGIGQGNSVAKNIRLAEMLIAKSAYPNATQLSSPDVNLKKLLTKPTTNTKQ